MTSINQRTNKATNQETGRYPTKELTNQLTMLLTFFFVFALLSPSPKALAADFAGRLKSVTITDSGGINTPPTAVISFTQNGDTVNFDASGSTDYGSIVEYRWNFGDGSTGVGDKVSHQFSSIGKFPVSLTVVDNEGGVAISQQQIDTSGGAVFYWSMDSLPKTSMLSDFGDVTITKKVNDATSGVGVKGKSMEQTGLRQYYAIPLTTIPAVKGRIEFYAKHDNLPDTSYRYFFKSTNIGGANTIYAYTYKTYIFFYLYDSAGVLHRIYKSSASWDVGTWYKYEFIWNGDTGYLGIIRDGVVLAESSRTPWSAPVWSANDELLIGDIYPIGSFDEFGIYKK